MFMELIWGDEMRVAEYKQISTRIEQRVIHHDAEQAEDGTIIKDAWCETVDVMVPIMGMVYRDATQEEIAEMERQQAELPEPEPTPEERLDALETTTEDMILLMADLIGGN